MTDDDAYRIATGTDPVTDLLAAQGLDEYGLPVLSDDEVLAFLAQHLSPAKVAAWVMRAEPADGQQHPGLDWVTVDAAQLDDGTAIAVAWSFGQLDEEDEMLSWKKTWREVAGPMTVAEVIRYASDWAERTH